MVQECVHVGTITGRQFYKDGEFLDHLGHIVEDTVYCTLRVVSQLRSWFVSYEGSSDVSSRFCSSQNPITLEL